MKKKVGAVINEVVFKNNCVCYLPHCYNNFCLSILDVFILIMQNNKIKKCFTFLIRLLPSLWIARRVFLKDNFFCDSALL